MENARTAALRALLRVDRDEGYSNLVLGHTLDSVSLSRQDRSLATALTYGVLERRITLDYIIGCFSKLPLKRMSPKVLEILRMGVYQIYYLEKIPDSAAVNESVKLTRSCGAARASGFVNAVLRSLLRAKGKIPWPDPVRDPLKNWSVRYSCPEWLVSLWRESYGEERARRLLASLSDRPGIFVRVNNTLISEEQLWERLCKGGVKAERTGWPGNALRLETPGEISGLASYRKGFFHVQDLSSQLCCFLFGAQPGETVADVCAAPGGKSFTIAETMENRGKLYAFDKTEERVKLIREGAGRLQLPIIEARIRDAAQPKGSSPPADRVLCDAPCSGLGVLRRKPEIRYKSASAIDSLPDLQYLILCKSSELVKRGGALFYSTCTLNPRENSGVARRFLSEHPAYEAAPLRLPAGVARDVDEPENELTLMPYANGTDGFFIAAFRRRQE